MACPRAEVAGAANTEVARETGGPAEATRFGAGRYPEERVSPDRGEPNPDEYSTSAIFWQLLRDAGYYVW